MHGVMYILCTFLILVAYTFVVVSAFDVGVVTIALVDDVIEFAYPSADIVEVFGVVTFT